MLAHFNSGDLGQAEGRAKFDFREFLLPPLVHGRSVGLPVVFLRNPHLGVFVEFLLLALNEAEPVRGATESVGIYELLKRYNGEGTDQSPRSPNHSPGPGVV